MYFIKSMFDSVLFISLFHKKDMHGLYYNTEEVI